MAWRKIWPPKSQKQGVMRIREGMHCHVEMPSQVAWRRCAVPMMHSRQDRDVPRQGSWMDSMQIVQALACLKRIRTLPMQ